MGENINVSLLWSWIHLESGRWRIFTGIWETWGWTPWDMPGGSGA